LFHHHAPSCRRIRSGNKKEKVDPAPDIEQGADPGAGVHTVEPPLPLLAATGSEKSAKSVLSHRSGLGHRPTHGDDFFLTGKWAHVTSRDICLCVYFAMLLLLPATGLLVALLAGNPHANSWQSSVRVSYEGYYVLRPSCTHISSSLRAVSSLGGRDLRVHLHPNGLHHVGHHFTRLARAVRTPPSPRRPPVTGCHH